MLLLEGVYTTNRYGKHRFQYVRAPLSYELTRLVHTISYRIAVRAQRLKRVFNIDIEVCDIGGKKAKVISCIEDPVVIKKILAHLKQQIPATKKYAIPEAGGSLGCFGLTVVRKGVCISYTSVHPWTYALFAD